MNRGVITPMRSDFLRARARDSAYGTNPSWLMAVTTVERISGLTFWGAFNTRDTVAGLTPAALATS